MTHRLNFLSLLIFCGVFLPQQQGYSQNFDEDYTPLRDYRADEKLISSIYKSYDSLAKSISFDNNKSNKEFKNSVTRSKASLKSLDSAGYLMKKDNITSYLQKLVDFIQKSNAPLQKHSLNIFTYRTEIPNASNRSAGLILFNLDLLSKLNNEEELTFIICHEISHDMLGHVGKSMVKKTEMDKNPKYKKELEKIKRQEFNRLQAYEALLAKYLEEFTGERRAMELQADSMGLLLYLNCGYKPENALNVITKLDSVDQFALNDSVKYSTYFNFKQYPFKNSWLEEEQEEESFGGNIDETFDRPDSLKTHPDCKSRREALEKLLAANNNPHQVPTALGNFNVIRKECLFEMVEYYQDEYMFSEALFYITALLEKHPKNKYLQVSFLNSLYEVATAQRDHYFSSVVEYPNRTFGPNYYRFLVFMHNSNSDIMTNFYKNYKTEHALNYSGEYIDYVNSLIKSSDLDNVGKEELFNAYSVKYSNGYYIPKLQIKLHLKKTTKK